MIVDGVLVDKGFVEIVAKDGKCDE